MIREAPTGGFWGEVPALPACYSQGESIDESLETLHEAIGACGNPETVKLLLRHKPPLEVKNM